jgi:mono/diheme cytochrome c family protein
MPGLVPGTPTTLCLPKRDGRDKPGHDEALADHVPSRRLLGVITLSLACAVSIGATAQAQDPTPDQIDQGRQVFDDLCATCHGRDMVSPGLVTFDLRKFPKDAAARFRNSVLNGKGAAMPPWQGKISDEELTLLWAYVRGGP